MMGEQSGGDGSKVRLIVQSLTQHVGHNDEVNI
jgi:hypothetical protein